MRLYFGGAESPTLRRRLREGGAECYSVSYWHLRERLPRSGEFPFRERFPEGARILLDSGGFSANRNREKYSDDELVDYLNEYIAFATFHADQLDLISEFDLLDYSPEDLWALRFDVWSALPDEKLLPVWHPEHGFDELHALADAYGLIAVPGEALKEMGHRLPAIANRFGVRFHGLSVTSEKVIRTASLASVSSTSWVSPTRHGDRVVWDGGKLHRYPKKYADHAVRDHRDVLEREEFDVSLVESGDAEELAALTVWSLQEWAHHLDRSIVTTPEVEPGASNAEPGSREVGTSPVPGGTSLVPRNLQDRKILPVLGFVEKKLTTVDGNGEETSSTSLEMHTQVDSARRCNTCYIRQVCPEFTPDSACAYDIPIEIKTKDQLTAMLTGMLEMQTQRAAFARFAEELEGGYPTEKVSAELDRLMEMTKKVRDIQDDRDFMRIHVEARGNAGVISRLFGDQAGARNRELDHPLPPEATDSLLADVIDVHPE